MPHSTDPRQKAKRGCSWRAGSDRSAGGAGSREVDSKGGVHVILVDDQELKAGLIEYHDGDLAWLSSTDEALTEVEKRLEDVHGEPASGGTAAEPGDATATSDLPGGSLMSGATDLT